MEHNHVFRRASCPVSEQAGGPTPGSSLFVPGSATAANQFNAAQMMQAHAGISEHRSRPYQAQTHNPGIRPIQPLLVIIEQPSKEFRFRYEKEGNNHGCLPGRSENSFPTLQLRNYPLGWPVSVVVRVYTRDGRRHFHKLVGPNCENGQCVLDMDENYQCVLRDVQIRRTENYKVKDILKANITTSAGYDEEGIENYVKQQMREIQLKYARLCFQAINRISQEPIGEPVLSDNIYDHKEKLHIVYMSRNTSASLNEEMCLLCKSIDKKDIQLRFYQEDNSNQLVWETRLDQRHINLIHFQTALVFNIPPYRDPDIASPVQIWIQLCSKQGRDSSKSHSFFYIPRPKDPHGIAQKTSQVPNSEDYLGFLHHPSELYASGSSTAVHSPGTQRSDHHGGNEINYPTAQPMDDDHHRYQQNFRPPEGMMDFQPSASRNEVPVSAEGSQGPFQGGELVMSPPSATESLSPYSVGSESMFETPPESVPTWQWADLSEEDLNDIEDLIRMDGRTKQQANGDEWELDKAVVSDKPHVRKCQESNKNVTNIDDLPGSFSTLKLNNTKRPLTRLRYLTSDTSDSTPTVWRNKPERRVESSNCATESTPINGHSEKSKSTKKSQDQRGQLKDARVILNQIYKTNCKDFVEKEMSPKLSLYLRHFGMTGKTEPILWALAPFISLTDKEGDNLLHLAVLHQSKNEQLFQGLEPALRAVKDQGTINNSNNLHQTPLHLAVILREYKVVEYFLDNGSDPNIQDLDGSTPVHLAVLNKDTRCLEMLCEPRDNRIKPDLNILNYDSLSAMHLCVLHDLQECMIILLNAGADPNTRNGTSGQTPLHLAVQRQSPMVEFLVTQPGVDVDAQDYGGCSPLHNAVSSGSAEMVFLLMKNNATPSLSNALVGKPTEDDKKSSSDSEGETPLDLAEDQPALLRLLKREASAEEITALEVSRKNKIETEVKRRTSQEPVVQHNVSGSLKVEEEGE